MVTKDLTIDLAYKGIIPVVNAVQGEDCGRVLRIDLKVDSVSFTLDSTTDTVEICFRKPDGTGGAYNQLPDGTAAYTISGTYLNVTLAPQVCTVAGRVLLSIGIIRGAKKIYTFTIHMDVDVNPGYQATSENYYKVAGSLAESGWTPNKYLITDADGNVITGDAPAGGGGLSEEWAEQIQANTDAIAASPVVVDAQGYTDIAGLRQAVKIVAVNSDDTKTIDITATLQKDVTKSFAITYDDNKMPVAMTVDGVECALEFQGFGALMLQEWTGGSY